MLNQSINQPLESRCLLSMQPEVRLQDNLIVKRRDGRVQVVISVTLRKRLFEITHNAAHLGSRRTYQQLNTSYYWYGMRQDIIRWYHQCQHCAKGKELPLRPHGQLQKIPPMDLVTMDILSGLQLMMDQSTYSWSWTLSQSGWKLIHFQTKRPRRALQLCTRACSPDSDCLVNCIQTKVETLRVNWSQSSVTSQQSTRPGLQRSIHALIV